MPNTRNLLTVSVLLCTLALFLGCPPPPDVIPDDDDDDVPEEPARASAVWARRAGGPTNDVADAIALAPDGGSLVTGYFSSTAVFSASTQQEVAWGSAGDNDIFIAKYDPDGAIAWVTAAGGSGTDEGLGIAVLSDGSFYAAGVYSLYATFGVRDPIQRTLLSAGLLDIFLARFNADGSLRFATRAGGTKTDEANDVAALDNGRAFLTGYFTDQAVFGPREANETVLEATDAEDLFIAAYNADGELDWAKRAGGTGTDVGMGIAAYPDGSSVAVGYLGGQFKNGQEKNLNRDAYIVRFDGLGDREWFRQIGGSGDAVAHDVAALPGGDCIVVGAFTGTLTFGQGESTQTTFNAGTTLDAFFARFTSDGDLVWVKRATSALGEAQAYTVSAYDDDTFVAGGYLVRNVIFDPGEPSENELEAIEGQDLFAAKFDTDGGLITVAHGGGDGDDVILGVAAGPDNDFLAAGAFNDPITLGLDSSSEIDRTTSGLWDILVVQFAEEIIGP